MVTSVQTQSLRDPDETADVKSLVAEVVADPDIWTNTPNDVLGGKSPNELIEANQGERVRELARAIKAGMAS